MKRLHSLSIWVYDDIKSDLNVNTLNNLSQYCRFVVPLTLSLLVSYLHVRKINFPSLSWVRVLSPLCCGDKESERRWRRRIWKSNFKYLKFQLFVDEILMFMCWISIWLIDSGVDEIFLNSLNKFSVFPLSLERIRDSNCGISLYLHRRAEIFSTKTKSLIWSMFRVLEIVLKIIRHEILVENSNWLSYPALSSSSRRFVRKFATWKLSKSITTTAHSLKISSDSSFLRLLSIDFSTCKLQKSERVQLKSN